MSHRDRRAPAQTPPNFDSIQLLAETMLDSAILKDVAAKNDSANAGETQLFMSAGCIP